MHLLAKLRVAFFDYENEQPTRKRGMRNSMLREDQFFLCLHYMRAYATFLVLGFQFGISESYAWKRYNFIKIDVSEQVIERPVKNQKNFTVEKKLHTIKVLMRIKG